MKSLRTKAVILAAIMLFIALAMGTLSNMPSVVLAQEPTAKVRPVQRIAVDAPRFVAGEVLVRFRANLPEDFIEAQLRARGARTLSVSRITGHRRIAIPPGMSEEAFLEHLTALPDVVAAQLNHIAYAFENPYDPEYFLQWHYAAGDGGINVVSAWGTYLGPNQVSGYNGSGVTVAVIDTGLAYQAFPPVPQAPEWKDQQWKVVLPPGVDMDLVNLDAEPNDDNGHGTHVANTISQNTNNGILAAGVANGAKIMPIKVIDASGSGTESDIAVAIHLAADYGAEVINMSLGFPTGTTAGELPLLAEAVKYAFDKGVTIVAAAGNDAASSCSYPAAFPEVICVGATRYDGNLAWYSNYGDLDLVAPGGAYCDSANDVLCLLFGYPYYYNDQNNDGWPDGVLQETFGSDYTFDDWFYEGTSMASPHVAAVAALVIGKAKDDFSITLTPEQVRGILTSGARDKGSSGYDSIYGWGLLDASGALAQVVGPSPTPPAAPSNLTATGASSSQINLAWIDNSGNETGFKIERCDGAGCTDFRQIATVSTGVTSYANTNLPASTTYTYRVRAYNAASDSDYSNVASATTWAVPPLPPAAPSNLTTKVVSRSQINLSWLDKATNEDGFEIERCTGSTCTNFAWIATVGSNVRSYSDTNLSSRTTYRYRIRAYNAGGDSNYSNVAKATTRR